MGIILIAGCTSDSTWIRQGESARDSGNFDQAVSCFFNAVKNGDKKGLEELNSLIRRNVAGRSAYAQILPWYESNAGKGDPYIQHHLAFMYDKGIGTERDPKKASAWFLESAKSFRKIADEGDVEAQMYLGFYYQKGWGVARDNRESLRWFHKAADQGYAPVLRYLAVMYSNGIGVERDRAEQEKWEKRAALAGEKR